MTLTVNKAVTEENQYRRCHPGVAGPHLGEASILTITKCRKEEPVKEAWPCDTYPVGVKTVSLKHLPSVQQCIKADVRNSCIRYDTKNVDRKTEFCKN